MKSLKALVAVCIAEKIFELLIPQGSMKTQLKTAGGMVFLAVLVKLIFEFFGR